MNAEGTNGGGTYWDHFLKMPQALDEEGVNKTCAFVSWLSCGSRENVGSCSGTHTGEFILQTRGAVRVQTSRRTSSGAERCPVHIPPGRAIRTGSGAEGSQAGGAQ